MLRFLYGTALTAFIVGLAYALDERDEVKDGTGGLPGIDEVPKSFSETACRLGCWPGGIWTNPDVDLRRPPNPQDPPPPADLRPPSPQAPPRPYNPPPAWNAPPSPQDPPSYSPPQVSPPTTYNRPPPSPQDPPVVPSPPSQDAPPNPQDPPMQSPPSQEAPPQSPPITYEQAPLSPNTPPPEDVNVPIDNGAPLAAPPSPQEVPTTDIWTPPPVLQKQPAPIANPSITTFEEAPLENEQAQEQTLPQNEPAPSLDEQLLQLNRVLF